MDKIPKWLETSEKEIEKFHKKAEWRTKLEESSSLLLILFLLISVIYFLMSPIVLAILMAFNISKYYLLFYGFFVAGTFIDLTIIVFILSVLGLTNQTSKKTLSMSCALLYTFLYLDKVKFKKWLYVKNYFLDCNFVSPLRKTIGSRKNLYKITDEFINLINNEIEIAILLNNRKSSQKIIQMFKDGLRIYLTEETVIRYGMLHAVITDIRNIIKQDKYLNSMQEKYYKKSRIKIIPIVRIILSIIRPSY